MATVAKSVSDALRSYDRNLALMFDSERKRWVVNRFGDFGEYTEVFVLESEQGEYVEPRIDVVHRLFQNDLSKEKGLTSRDRIRNKMRRQDAENAAIREKGRVENEDSMKDRMAEWAESGKRFGGDAEGLAAHMAKDGELLKDQELTTTEKNRVLRGVTP